VGGELDVGSGNHAMTMKVYMKQMTDSGTKSEYIEKSFEIGGSSGVPQVINREMTFLAVA